MVTGGTGLAISIILALMSLVFGVAPKVTLGRADAVVALVVGGGACRWKDSPVPLFAVLMVRAPRLGAAATAVAVVPVRGTGGAVII